MEEFFQLSKTDNFILYGAGTQGKIVGEILKKNGFLISAFIDKRADEIESLLDVPVYSLSWLEEHKAEYKHCVLYITVKNVFEHDAIAEMLYKTIGNSNIIYRPYSLLAGYPDEKDYQLNEAYDLLLKDLSNYRDHFTVQVPCYLPGKAFPLIDHALQKQEKDFVLAAIPAELIFTNDIKKAWCRLPVLALHPHIALFRYYAGKEESPEWYLRFCRKSAEATGVLTSVKWEENVLRNRMQVYDEMTLAMQIKQSFFFENAPTAQYDISCGRFYLTSGKHRAAFLVSKEWEYILLRLSQKDYTAWRETKAAQMLQNYMNTKNDKKIPAYFPHTYFYRASVIDREKRSALLKMIYEVAAYQDQKYGIVDFEKLQIICDEEGVYFGMFFSYMGAQLDNKSKEDNSAYFEALKLLCPPWQQTQTKEPQMTVRILKQFDGEAADLTFLYKNGILSSVKTGEL